MFDWLVKKVIVSKVNDLLKDNKDNIAKVRNTLKKWIDRIKKILTCFESLMSKLDDNQLDTTECKEAAKEIEKLVKEW